MNSTVLFLAIHSLFHKLLRFMIIEDLSRGLLSFGDALVLRLLGSEAEPEQHAKNGGEDDDEHPDGLLRALKLRLGDEDNCAR